MEATAAGNLALESRNAIRCVKVALLLSRLKSSADRRRIVIDDTADHHAAPDEAVEVLMREIGDLKMEVVKERLRNKRIKLCGLFELFLEVSVLSALCAIFFVFFFARRLV